MHVFNYLLLLIFVSLRQYVFVLSSSTHTQPVTPDALFCWMLLVKKEFFLSFLPSLPLLQKHLLIGSHDCCDLLYSLYNIVGSSPYTFKLQYKAP